MKLATKVNKSLFEALVAYNGKEAGFNAEAGDTSFDEGHWHKTMIDEEGNGETIHVMSVDMSDETKPIKSEKGHVHQIVRWVVQEEEGHTHNVIS